MGNAVETIVGRHLPVADEMLMGTKTRFLFTDDEVGLQRYLDEKIPVRPFAYEPLMLSGEAAIESDSGQSREDGIVDAHSVAAENVGTRTEIEGGPWSDRAVFGRPSGDFSFSSLRSSRGRDPNNEDDGDEANIIATWLYDRHFKCGITSPDNQVREEIIAKSAKL